MVTFLVVLATMFLSTNALPTEIIFGQTSIFSGPTKAVGLFINGGIRAAFKEVNDNGGIFGSIPLKLAAEDDELDPAKTVAAVGRLLGNHSDLLAFICNTGTMCNVAQLPIVLGNQIPSVAPYTGATAFRTNFIPNLIHLRAGYDVETLVMLDLLLNKKRANRIAMVYQDDDFGVPALTMVSDSLEKMGMKLSYSEGININDVPNANEIAQRLLVSRPQGLILFVTQMATLDIILSVKTMVNWNITIVTGSWQTSSFRVKFGFGQANITSDNIYVTQVLPHPEADNPLSASYRRAYTAFYNALSPSELAVFQAETPALTFEQYSFEGYVAGRLAIEILKRGREFTRQEFLQIVYGTQMFQLDGFVAGPFTRPCLKPREPGEPGRSSLCQCSQGFRFVYLFGFDSSWIATDVEGSQRELPLDECFSTSDLITFEPVVAQLHSTETISIRSATQFAKGLSKAGKKKFSVMDISYSPGTNLTALTADILDRTLATAFVGEGAFESSLSEPMIGMFSSPALLDSESSIFHRADITFASNLRQEIFSAVHFVFTNQHNPPIVHGLFNENFHKQAQIRSALQKSVEHFDLPDVAIVSSFSTLTDAELAVFTSGYVGVFGITTDEEMATLLQHSSSQISVTFFVPFVEAAHHWDVIQSLCQTLDCRRLFFSTSIPLWFPTNSSTSQTQKFVQEANVSTPLEMMGFAVGMAVGQILPAMGTSITPSSFLDAVYRLGMIPVGENRFGPFVDQQCTTTNCLCSHGARSIATFRIADLVNRSIATQGVAYDFTECSVVYRPRPAKDGGVSTTLILAIVLPVGLALLGVGAIVGWRFIIALRVAHAPKDGNQPCHIMFFSLKNETLLWERYPIGMAAGLKECGSIIKKAIKTHRCYLVKMIESSYMIAAKNIGDAMRCAADVQRAVGKIDWEEFMVSHGETAPIRKGEKSAEARSRTSDVRSSHSGSSKASVGIVDMAISFGAGIHSGLVQIDFNEEANSYNYLGPTVTASAIVSDVAQGGQILLTDGQPNDEYEERVEEFVTWDVQGKQFMLYQFNPPGIPKMTFSVIVEDDTRNVDGVAAAVQQADNGVVKKTTTLLVASIPDLKDDSTSIPLKQFSTELSAKFEKMSAALTSEKGHLESIAGGNVVVSFNAAAPVPHQAIRAFSAALQLREIFGDGVRCGIGSGKSLVGPFTIGKASHVTTIGHVLDTAHALERYCRLLGNANVNIISTDLLADELSISAVYQALDIVHVRGQGKPRCLLGLMSMHDTGAADEWMYELQNASTKDVFAHLNSAFKDLAGSDAHAATEARERFLSDEVWGASSDEWPGLEVGRKIAEVHGVQAYLAQPNPRWVY